MAKIKVAVLGTGSLGQHHARIYSELDKAGLVQFAGVFDANAEAAKTIAAKHNARVFSSIAEAAQNADALNIVTPTITHFDIAKQLLAQGKHVLVEKPMTDNSAQAGELIELAKKNNCVLQVGHVERFNPVFKFLQSAAPEPRFIECNRLSPYPARSMDVGVVLDLMIHDLDIVLALVKSPVASVDAAGIPVLSKSEDIANARLKFANGCIASITASRVSPERVRKIHLYNGPTNPAYFSMDFRLQEGFVSRLRTGQSALPPNANVVTEFGDKKIVREPVPIEKAEPLKLELEHFVECVREKKTPMVNGESAKLTLDLAFEITQQIQQQKT